MTVRDLCEEMFAMDPDAEVYVIPTDVEPNVDCAFNVISVEQDQLDKHTYYKLGTRKEIVCILRLADHCE